MRKAIKVKHYTDDHTIYIRYSESTAGGYTREIGPELQGPTYVTRNTDSKRFSWVPKRQFEIIVDFEENGEVSAIELLRDDEKTQAFVKTWCQEHKLEFPKL